VGSDAEEGEESGTAYFSRCKMNLKISSKNIFGISIN
jgi:hypothetical protein